MTSGIQEECLCRVLRIKVGSGTGSAFTYERDGIQFLFTAKHLFQPNFDRVCSIELLLNNGLALFTADVFYSEIENVDIAVIKLHQAEFVTPTYGNQQFGSGNIIYGQDVFFLGFPYQFYNDRNTQFTPLPGSQLPVPFIKKACLSAIAQQNDCRLLFLDGHNNPGFSGGPVCYKPLGSSTMAIAGVVSSYVPERKEIHDNVTNSPVINSNVYFYTEENTGIIIAYDIKHATDIVNKILGF